MRGLRVPALEGARLKGNPSGKGAGRTMVDVTILGESLVVRVRGLGKLWALRSRVTVPLAAVRSVRHDPDAAGTLWPGWRVPGTHFPGLITAGTYYWRGVKSFWSVKRKGNAVVIDLEGATFDRLVVDVADPEATVALIEGAAPRLRS